MIYKTLTVATFGLLAWQTVQLNHYKEETKQVSNQLETIISNINQLEETTGKSKIFFDKQMVSQEKLEKVLLGQSEVLASLGGGVSKSKNKPAKKPKQEKPKKLTLKESNELIKRLAKIEVLQKNKKKEKAIKALGEFKKAIWKLKNKTNVGKAKVLSISTSIDVVLNNWKTSSKVYPASSVKQKILAINSPKKIKPSVSKPLVAKKSSDKKGKQPKSVKTSNKLTAVELGDLKKRLIKIDNFQKNKDIKSASKELTDFKQEIWKVAQKENVGRKLVGSISSSIDITQNKWKGNEVTYPVTKITEKLNYIKAK